MAHSTKALAGFSLAPIVGICAFRLSAWSVFGWAYVTDTASAYSWSRLAQLVTILIIMLLSTRRTPGRKAQTAIVVSASFVMALAALLCLGRGPQEPLFVAARLLHGACSSVLIMAWGAFTCAIEPRKSAVYVSVAFAIYGALTLALQGANESIMAGVSVVAPIASGMLFCLAPGAREGFVEHSVLSTQIESPAVRGKKPADALCRIDWGVVALLLACCLVCSVSEILINPGLAGTSLYMANAFRVLAFALLACIYCAWVFILRRNDPDRLWPLFSCTVFFGLLGYSSFSFADEEASASFMSATQDCIMLFAWVFVSGTCFRLRLPKLITFGLGSVLFMRTDLIAGLLEMAGMTPSGKADATVSVALSFAMAAVLIVYTIALLWRNATRPNSCMSEKTAIGVGQLPVVGVSSPQTKTAPSPSADRMPDQTPAWLVPYDLTAREEQVVELLLRGYTLPQIGERFSVSLNTARYYAKTIYRKLDIHSKAELIALAEHRSQ